MNLHSLLHCLRHSCGQSGPEKNYFPLHSAASAACHLHCCHLNVEGSTTKWYIVPNRLKHCKNDAISSYHSYP